MTTAVLLINLGTPKSPKPSDVYRYLIEFLNDERVIDVPWLYRQFLVRGIIVPNRYKASAASYQAIWTSEGSPLMLLSQRLKTELQDYLGNNYIVELAMRYQEPSIESILQPLLEKRPDHLMIVPLFPQYASATTGSVHQKVMEILRASQVFPRLSFISHYFNHPSLLKAYKEIAAPYLKKQYDHVLFSFHGLPKKQLQEKGCQISCSKNSCCYPLSGNNQFCYSAQCHEMAHKLAKILHIPQIKYSITFQSRLGKDPWLEPFTNETLLSLAKLGQKRVLVFCPSFVCDCLETIFEIEKECREEFLQAGGEELDLVPSLNAHPAWVKALAEIIHQPQA
ncbi:MAG: ferrochelatase [Parachlamydiaceae bacterium]